MIKKFNNFSKMNESNEAQKLVDQILDKINDYGYDNLSSLEREILQKASSGGIESLEEYIDSEDDDVLSFDKHGHILINGVPYTEWSTRKDKKKDKSQNPNEWSKTSKENDNVKKPDYIVRAYKSNNNNIVDYILVWDSEKIENIKGTVKKYSTIKKPENPYGIITTKNVWEKKSIKQLHEEYFDVIYDRYRDLTVDELNLFETFMILRQRYKKNDLTDQKDQKNLDNLYNKFSNL